MIWAQIPQVFSLISDSECKHLLSLLSLLCFCFQIYLKLLLSGWRGLDESVLN